VTETPYPQAGRSVFFSARDGLRIHVRIYEPDGQDRGLPVVCLPGLSRNSRDFDLLARHLSTRAKKPHAVYCFDFRGRGQSGYDRNWKNYTILTEAEDVVDGLTALGIEHALFVGTSRGGLVTMILSALRAGAIKGAVFNDIGPVIEGDGLAQIRLYLRREPQPANWDEAAAIQKEIMGLSFTDMADDDWMREAHARYRETDGRIRPDHDPALVKTMTGIDLEERLPTMWPQFDGLKNVPLLVIRGENSSLLSTKTVEAMLDRHRRAHVVTAKNHGHAPLLTKSELIDPIAAFAQDLQR